MLSRIQNVDQRRADVTEKILLKLK